LLINEIRGLLRGKDWNSINLFGPRETNRCAHMLAQCGHKTLFYITCSCVKQTSDKNSFMEDE